MLKVRKNNNPSKNAFLSSLESFERKRRQKGGEVQREIEIRFCYVFETKILWLKLTATCK